MRLLMIAEYLGFAVLGGLLIALVVAAVLTA